MNFIFLLYIIKKYFLLINLQSKRQSIESTKNAFQLKTDSYEKALFSLFSSATNVSLPSTCFASSLVKNSVNKPIASPTAFPNNVARM